MKNPELRELRRKIAFINDSGEYGEVLHVTNDTQITYFNFIEVIREDPSIQCDSMKDWVYTSYGCYGEAWYNEKDNLWCDVDSKKDSLLMAKHIYGIYKNPELLQRFLLAKQNIEHKSAKLQKARAELEKRYEKIRQQSEETKTSLFSHIAQLELQLSKLNLSDFIDIHSFNLNKMALENMLKYKQSKISEHTNDTKAASFDFFERLKT